MPVLPTQGMETARCPPAQSVTHKGARGQGPGMGSLSGLPGGPQLPARRLAGRGLRVLSDLVVCFGLLIKHVLSLVGGAS